MAITKAEARKRLRAFEAQLKAKPDPAFVGRLELIKHGRGEWIGATPVPPAFTLPAVRLETREPIAFLGALGKLVGPLGMPTSGERILGSSWIGRYQEFENGVANWEALRNKEGAEKQIAGVPNYGFPIFMGDYSPKRGESVNALIAFFDYRGFTKWSGKATPDRIQRVVLSLEVAFQDAFEPNTGPNVFAKGTGDGFMIVSEAPSDSKVDAKQAKDFVDRCRRTVIAAAASLKRERLARRLQVGCAVATGTVTRVYILGRFDYLGAAANRAAKLQGKTKNQICVDDGVHDLLGKPRGRGVTTKEGDRGQVLKVLRR